MSIRSIQDLGLIRTIAMAAAAASANTTGIKLSTGPHVEGFEGRIKVPATPSLVDAKTLTLTVQHSNDDGTTDAYADIPELASLVITGAGGVGAAAAERDFRFPPTTKMWVRLHEVTLAAAGDNTAISAELAILA